MLVIAEGVDSVEHYQWLKANGCHLIQGALVAQPLTAQDACRFVQPFDWGKLNSI
jgi:EAL domain-containing protein (putative c-di-GMP-specific phosphodiesterase class I)